MSFKIMFPVFIAYFYSLLTKSVLKDFLSLWSRPSGSSSLKKRGSWLQRPCVKSQCWPLLLTKQQSHPIGEPMWRCWAQPAVLREPLEAVFQQHGDDPVQVRYLTRAGSKNKAGEGVLLEPCSLAVRSATACLSPFPESAPASLDSPRRPDCCGPSCFFQAGLPLPIFLFNNGLGPARERQSAGLQAGAESSP